MRSLTDFLAGLPGIMPIKTRKLVLEGGVLSKAERADIYMRERNWLDLVLEVGPDAAAAILSAYKDGRLPMKRGCTPTDAPGAEAYLAEGDKLREQLAERGRREQAVKNLSLILERDLMDHRLIDSVFIANIGTGSGSMVLAGITVHKQVIGYKSNSGKSTGWRVRFDWTGSDGQPRHSETVPPEADNRRNDPDRNWGLHE
ncbi:MULTISPECIES: hypothetical protein [unclassified Agrobacterium]|uniref:hypothetical protein n=1 Tax=unclassified Agrobacterium TaxID=2632611 RepID=UPI0003782DDC|nr:MULTISPECIES: hypothetical protein [unclassified Agrobacterium]SNB72696.1 hypothetical protein SAMN05661103_3564 [Agrobacterium sp. 719_389]